MASFDFIEATSRGYEFSWYERSYLMRAAIPVIFAKLACVLVVRFMQVEDQNLLSGLIFMPAYIVEALFMISLVRYVAFREPLFEFSRVMGVGNESDPVLDEKVKGAEIQKKQSVYAFSREKMFKAGVVMYLLIKVVQLGLVGIILDYSKTLDPAVSVPAPEQNVVSAIIVMIFTGSMLWALRLLWLYIPVALGHSVRGFMARIRGMMSSLSIFATWFVCYFPMGMLIYGIFMLSNFVLVPDSALQVLVHDIIRAFGETVVILVQVVAMTFGFIEVLTQHKIKKENQKKKD